METQRITLKGVFSEDDTYNGLLYVLADLAGEWRETKSDTVAKRYQTLLKSLLEMGWDDSLDLELWLPPELMPTEYLKRNE